MHQIKNIKKSIPIISLNQAETPFANEDVVLPSKHELSEINSKQNISENRFIFKKQ